MLIGLASVVSCGGGSVGTSVGMVGGREAGEAGGFIRGMLRGRDVSQLQRPLMHVRPVVNSSKEIPF